MSQESPSTFSAKIFRAYHWSLQAVLNLLERVTDKQFFWRPGPQGHSIAYEVWHLARWADHLQSHIPDMTPELRQILGEPCEIWKTDRLAEKWGFPTQQLGYDETGMEMEDSFAASLVFDRASLMEYARQAIAQAQDYVSRIPESQYLEINRPNPEEAVIDAIMIHILHNGRHMGMIENLLGLQGQRGTATV